MQSMFTKYEEPGHEELLDGEALRAAGLGRGTIEVSEPSEPTLGALSKSRNETELARPVSEMVPSASDGKDRVVVGLHQ